MKDFRYLKDKDTFLKHAYLSLENHFPIHDDFIKYFNAIKTDELKNLFLKTASFYLFLVKRGSWIVDILGSNQNINYLNETYKYVAIFSLIESLSVIDFYEFYQYLIDKTSGITFPIQDIKELEELYKRYKDKYGSIKRCISFFKTLSPDRQHDLVSKLKVKGTNPTIDNLAKYLYELRSKFVHEAKLILDISETTSVGRWGKKLVVCEISLNDIMVFFEEGLLIYFQYDEI